MKYGYFLNGELITIEKPTKVTVGERKYTNPSDEHIKEAGYKEIREDEIPTYDEKTQKLEKKIVENEDVIYIKYLVSDIEEAL